MPEETPIVPLASSEREAFECFEALAVEGIVDARGQRIEVDLGDYVHVVHDEERILFIPWILPTITDPTQIISIRRRKRGKRITVDHYVRRLRESEDDAEGSLFVVVVERTPWGLRLRTWLSPVLQEEYVEKLRAKGEVIWRAG